MIPNPLASLPVNTAKAYVMATTLTGCKIYMPVVNNNEKFMNMKRDALQKYLNNQEFTLPPPEPIRA